MSPTAHQSAPSTLRFAAELCTIDDVTLVRLPETVSADLPSRGQVAAHATVGGHPFETVVEPDGRRGHWIRLPGELCRSAGLEPGDVAEMTLRVAQQWPEPAVPDDLADALAGASDAIRETWDDITPMARWEWVRWVGATRSGSTRQRRVEVSVSKLADGKRRPCCFDLSSCTDPQLARSGKLREPSSAGSTAP